MVFRTIICASLLGAAGLAHAQSWTEVTTSGTQTYSYDAASVQRSGSSVSFTGRLTMNPPQAMNDNSGRPIGEVATAIEQLTIDCAARTYVNRGSIGYSASGAVLTEGSTPRPSESIQSGTAAAAFAEVLCG